MPRTLSISILLTCLLFTGCSSIQQEKVSFLTEEQQLELKNIFDKHLTDEDWETYQHGWDRIASFANLDTDIDLKKDYDKDPMILMSINDMSSDKPELQKELTSFMKHVSIEKLPEDNGNKYPKEKPETSFR